MPFSPKLSCRAVEGGFRFLAFAVTAALATSAFSQSDPEQALQLLRLSLQCPVPLQTTQDENGKKRVLTIEKFTGDAQSLVVTGKSVVDTSEPQTSAVSTDEETFTYTAGFADLSGVSANSNRVEVACTKGSCIRKVSQHNLFPVPNCTRPSCDDAFRENQFQSKTMTLTLCDEETAENAKMAMEYLIRSNSVDNNFYHAVGGAPMVPSGHTK